MPARHTITVFGSSRPQPGQPEYDLAYDLGNELAREGFTICNGGYGGIMEASAHGAKDARGKTIGIICSAFAGGKANQWIDTTINNTTMVDRLLKLLATGDGYVVLKGGTGTLLELAAAWEFINKGMLARKPIVVVGGFWDEVVRTLKDELAWEGLESATRFVSIASSPTECVGILTAELSKQK